MRMLATVFCAIAALAAGPASRAADFDGDGTGEIAVFKASTGLWSVRGLTRIYLGSTGDIPVPGDYDGTGADRAAIFRASGGLWSVRDLTRAYFGSSGDLPLPGDYDADGRDEIATFREISGLWAVRNLTRIYFGGSGDTAISPGKTRDFGGGELLQTGQTVEYRSGDDGTYGKGASFSYQTQDPVGNGEIVTVDRVTGLTWASDGLGKGCNWGEQTSWSEAVDWAEGLVFAGFSDWRLPNIRELNSIVDFGLCHHAMNPAFFPNTQPLNYWSGTSYAGYTDSAWVVYFYEGTMGHADKAGPGCARAVRGGK